MSIFLYNLKNFEQTPQLFKFQDRNAIDPTQIANKLKEENIGVEDIDARIHEIYTYNNHLIENIYGDFNNYLEIVKETLLYGEDKKDIPLDIKEFPVELLSYKIAHTHNLEELMQEVIDEMFGGTYEGIQGIFWTDKPYRGFFAKYSPSGIVHLNLILDSPQVDKELIKFLIYHELLHRDYYKHDKNFYREEHKYPNYIEHNKFLDHEFGKFNFEI